MDSDNNRRWMLKNSGLGFGFLAFRSLMNATIADDVSSADGSDLANPLASKMPHFAARAKRVVFLFMKGGPSHVDTFDP
ncbi:MAG TPA: DUF1501 domain-containing protein, partial [Pirellula sp.]|nr:DUF1501 domain-containing protein [Pirellula sp.]